MSLSRAIGFMICAQCWLAEMQAITKKYGREVACYVAGLQLASMIK